MTQRWNRLVVSSNPPGRHPCGVARDGVSNSLVDYEVSTSDNLKCKPGANLFVSIILNTVSSQLFSIVNYRVLFRSCNINCVFIKFYEVTEIPLVVNNCQIVAHSLVIAFPNFCMKE